MQEEIFGPVLPVLECNSVDQAIDFINQREKPLALYLFTETAKNTEKVIEHTSSGGVCVNDCLMHATVPTMPFGGVGNSGCGSLHGKFGFDAFTHYKPCMRKSSGMEFINKVRYAPYSEKKMKRVVSLLFKTPDFTGKGKIKMYIIQVALVGLVVALCYKFFAAKL
jgi:aldehyde dehydrogenase (NAD+)